jgi:hypothetical protein
MAEITYTGCHKYVLFHSAHEPAAYYFRDDFFLQQMTTAIIRTGGIGRYPGPASGPEGEPGTGAYLKRSVGFITSKCLK